MRKMITIATAGLFLGSQLGWAEPCHLRPLATIKTEASAALAKSSSSGEKEKEDGHLDLDETKKGFDSIFIPFFDIMRRRPDKILAGGGKDYMPVLDYVGSTVNLLMKEDRFDDIEELMGHIENRILRLKNDAMSNLIFYMISQLFSKASYNLLEASTKEEDVKKAEIVSSHAEKYAKASIEYNKKDKLRRAEPAACDTLASIYIKQKRTEELISLCKDAILLRVDDRGWLKRWVAILAKTHISLKEDRAYSEEALFYYWVLYSLAQGMTADYHAVLYLGDIYTKHFFYRSKDIEKVKDILKRHLILLEKDRGIEPEEKDKLKADLLGQLVTASLLLGGIENYNEAIRLADEYGSLRPDDSIYHTWRLNAKRYIAQYYVGKDDRLAEQKFDEFIREYADAVNRIKPEGQGWKEISERYQRSYVEYLKGNYTKAEEAFIDFYGNIDNDNPEYSDFMVSFTYTDILLNLGREDDARKALFKFFGLLAKGDEKAGKAGSSSIYEKNFYQERERFNRVLDFIKRELETLNSWESAECAQFEYMLKFLFTLGDYKTKDFANVYPPFLDYLADKQPDMDFWPHIESVISAILSVNPLAARDFIRRAIILCDNEEVKQRLKSYLVNEALSGHYSLYDCAFFAIVNNRVKTPENWDFVQEVNIGSTDAYLTRGLERSEDIIEYLDKTAEDLSLKTGKTGLGLLLVHYLLYQINKHIRSFYPGPKEKKAYWDKLKETLLALTRKLKWFYPELDKVSGARGLDIYCLLADNFSKAEEYKAVLDLYRRLLKAYRSGDETSDVPAKILEASCMTLDLWSIYIASLLYSGKESELDEAVAVWINGVNKMLDRAESGERLPNRIDTEELCAMILNSILGIVFPLRRGITGNNDIKKTVERIIDMRLNMSFKTYGTLTLYKCAYIASVILDDTARFERLLALANTEETDTKIDYEYENYWAVRMNYLLGYLYRRNGQDSLARDACRKAEEIFGKVKKRRKEDEAIIPVTEATAAILEEDYPKASDILEKGIAWLSGNKEYDIYKEFLFITSMYLVITYLAAGRAEEAEKALNDAVISEAEICSKAKADRKEYLLNRSKLSCPNHIIIVPSQLRGPFVKFLAARLIRSEMPEGANTVMLNLLEMMDAEHTISVLIEHFRDIIDGGTEFDKNRDLNLIRWLLSASTSRRLIIDELCQRLAASKNVDKESSRAITKARMQKAVAGVGSGDYIIAARDLYDAGDFRKALRLIKQGIEVASRQAGNGGLEELRALQAEIQTASDKLEGLKEAYERDDYDRALLACEEVLNVNPKNTFAQHAKENIAQIRAARRYFEESDLTGTEEALNRLPHSDKKSKQLCNDLAVIRDRMGSASNLLDENRYQHAQKTLEGLPKSYMGIRLDEQSTLLRDLYRNIRECKQDAQRYAEKLNLSMTPAELYGRAQLLLQYPEHKDEVFGILIDKSVEAFNAQGDNGENYKLSFNTARLVYELKDYKPDERYLKKAQSIISQAVSNIWLPELMDDHFMVKAMSEAERFRDERERREMGLSPKAQLKFKFRYCEMTETGFVLYGFEEEDEGEKRKEKERDIRDFAREGDAFIISAQEKERDSSESPSENPQPLFRLSYADEGRLVFNIPNMDEDHIRIIKDLKATLRKGGIATRIHDSTWTKQEGMLDSITRTLKRTTAERLTASLDKAPIATTNNTALDHALGILLDIPDGERDSTQEKALVAKKELEEELTLDKEERDAIIDALNTNIPSTMCQGPGGTGKTFVITWIIELLTPDKGKRLRVRTLSQTNPGVDNIAEKLKERGTFFVRVGNDETAVKAEIIEVWEEKVERLKKIKRGFEPDIILGTINGFANDHDIRVDPEFQNADYVIVDEASRATVPESLWALFMFRGIKKFILVGDHYQLPAYGITQEDVDFVKKEFAERLINNVKIEGFGKRGLDEIFEHNKLANFRISLLEKVLKLFDDKSGIYQVTRPNFHFFKVNRRSGTLIVDLDNYFYEGRLIAGREIPGIIIEDDYKGKYQDDKIGGDIINIGEAAKSIIWTQKILAETNLKTKEIGIITPYSKQEEVIREAHLAMARIFELLENMKTSGITEGKADLVRSYIQEQQVIMDILINELHPYEPPGKLRQLLAKVKEGKKADDLKALREYLGFGDRFIPSTDIANRFFSISTIDSAIGSEWKAVAISWVRANYKKNYKRYGAVGFLKDKIDGWRRRNVGIGRAMNILISMADKDTFEHADDPEIIKWQKYNNRVFEKAHNLEWGNKRGKKFRGCDRLELYRDMFGDEDSLEELGIDVKLLKAIAAAA